jgi:glycosyltransferase involved in cell wall biosynthesis
VRIAILQGAFLPVPPLLGGAVEKIWFELGRQFAARGHEVTHVSRQHPELPDKEFIDGVRHLRVPGFDTPRNLVALKLMDLVYTARALRCLPVADVTVTNTFWAPLLLKPARAGVIVVDVQRMPKGQMRFYHRAKRWRAVSSAVAQALEREQPLETDRIRIIPNPLPFRARLEPEDSLRGKGKVILYAGRLHPEKGLDLLIRALHDPRLEPCLREWRLDIVGPWEACEGGGGGGYLNQLKKLAAGLPVTFVGPKHDPAALAEHYRRSAIFAYPSVAEAGETFGVAPLEAMAYGAVPVVSDLACFRDFIEAGRNGVIFNHRAQNPESQIASAIFDLVSNETLRGGLARAALAVNHSHAPEKIAARFLEDYASLTGKTA